MDTQTNENVENILASELLKIFKIEKTVYKKGDTICRNCKTENPHWIENDYDEWGICKGTPIFYRGRWHNTGCNINWKLNKD
tara:strand:+ start:214 stop:459 length:246 start_codon:yes stop_codon:yes gene_type:complete